ncbi:SH3 domain-binding glutamic acid-rich-like protein [Liparis tanakae]|uniref:SH3 domain-binding glutamic acid-rich-like protein n=1 Tax=Liparis tanakae TaxID=230148 RepID=A0A4Z2FCY5_9TELE|nr:SH3 domain-binding glutamic acid-rich-like protein [Liparis tanakae]
MKNESDLRGLDSKTCVCRVGYKHKALLSEPRAAALDKHQHRLTDYEAFFDAREDNAVYAFLGLTAPPGSKEAEALAKKAQQ